MPKLAHPPPAAVHGLLAVKIGAPFAKRVRRVAHLENALLELRRNEGAPVEWSMRVSDVAVTSDANKLCITLVWRTLRMRLYVSSHAKFGMWLKALQQSLWWQLQRYYHLEPQPFAHGHCAAVYRAHDRATRAVVAVKHIDARAAHAGAHVVSRELRVCKLVHHCNLVHVRDVFESSNGAYIVMDAVEHTLQQLIERSCTVSERVAAHLTKQLLCALAYLHALNIVHRDVKPDNILLTELSAKPTLKLCDFGLANFTANRVWRRRSCSYGARCASAATEHNEHDEHDAHDARRPSPRAGGFTKPMPLRRWAHAPTTTDDDDGSGGIDGQTLTTAVGAPSFTAPELLKRRAYGAPVDVWACGVTLFYMLTGRLPFAGDSVRAVTDAIRGARGGAPPADVSLGAADLLGRMLRADPRQRITAESALQHHWLYSH